jgi:hypothetical protein
MYRNFIDYPLKKVQTAKRVKMATGDEVAPAEQTWLQRNKKPLLIVGAVLLVGLLVLPDALIRKYVPFVK